MNPAPLKRCIETGFTLAMVVFAVFAAFGTRVGLSQLITSKFGNSAGFGNASKLSPSEIEAVTKLACRAGLTNVASIQTDDYGGIKLGGPELTEGREVPFVSVLVEPQRGIEGSLFNLTNTLHSDGQYCVLRGGVRTNKLTLFETKGRTIRVELLWSISLSEADALVAMLAEEKIRYTDDESKERATAVEISKPNWIGRGKNETISIGFSCGKGCSLVLDCNVENGAIVVKRSSRFFACG